ncbi:MAG: hypothetical protein FWD87_01800 [Spirochaetaceae bacterium]|nr:hypothetical protein [Spirochaetaceae bacterium]
MKKILVLLICLVLLVSFIGCETTGEQRGIPQWCLFCNEETRWKITDGTDQCSVCGNYWKWIDGGNGTDRDFN